MKENVFAILRFDSFHAADSSPEVTITVTCIVRSQETAEAEVRRLNALNGAKGARYWWQQTRLIPDESAALGQQ